MNTKTINNLTYLLGYWKNDWIISPHKFHELFLDEYYKLSPSIAALLVHHQYLDQRDLNMLRIDNCF